MMNWLKTLMPLILVDSFKTDYDAKINKIKGKIPSITSLATTGALNAVNNEIPSVSDLLKNRL